jgi:hypothetical protein
LAAMTTDKHVNKMTTLGKIIYPFLSENSNLWCYIRSYYRFFTHTEVMHRG